MPRREELTGVPDSEVESTVKDFKDAGATKAEKEKENGTWKVTATFPDS